MTGGSARIDRGSARIDRGSARINRRKNAMKEIVLRTTRKNQPPITSRMTNEAIHSSPYLDLIAPANTSVYDADEPPR